MAGAPQWKVYSDAGEYVAACKHVEDAAAIVAMRGDGTTIRFDHSKKLTVWTEGQEDQPAGESYDHVATVAQERLDALLKAAREKREAENARRVEAMKAVSDAARTARAARTAKNGELP